MEMLDWRRAKISECLKWLTCLTMLMFLMTARMLHLSQYKILIKEQKVTISDTILLKNSTVFTDKSQRSDNRKGRHANYMKNILKSLIDPRRRLTVTKYNHFMKIKQAQDRFRHLIRWKPYLKQLRYNSYSIKNFSVAFGRNDFLNKTYLILCNKAPLNVTVNNTLPICSCVPDTIGEFIYFLIYSSE